MFAEKKEAGSGGKFGIFDWHQAKIGMTPVLVAGAVVVATVGFVCSRTLKRSAVTTT